MNAKRRTEAYAAVSRVASPTASEGLKKERSILLLWFLRNAMGIDDLDAYEYICDGNGDEGIDALWLEPGPDVSGRSRLVVFQSKYPKTPKNVGKNDLKTFVSSAEPLGSLAMLPDLLGGKLEPELRALIENLHVQELLEKGTLDVRLIFVTAGILTPEASAYIKTINKKHGPRYLSAYDLAALAPLVEAFQAPRLVKAARTIDCSADSRFQAELEGGRVLVCAIKAAEIVDWPGIDDRTLFDLNVRRELRRASPVRSALDEAIRKKLDHRNFLAFHNGLTVVCAKFDCSSPTVIKVTDLSVVNGAQSTIALRDNISQLSDGLRLLVKFVEVPPDQQLAREVAIRSNTQNPVTNRNLRARDGIQLRLVAEFGKEFPGVVFETMPDASMRPAGRVIQNDDAAQLLCAIYNEKPWLAVKRLSLFDDKNYPMIYHEHVSAAHIRLTDLIATMIQGAKKDFPERYRKSWQLTKLVAAYLAGQLLRTSTEGKRILDAPGSALKDEAFIERELDRVVRGAVTVLKVRADQRDQKQGAPDEFKVDFKRERELRALAETARVQYIFMLEAEAAAQKQKTAKAKKKA